MSTLKIGLLTWNIESYEGKTAYVYGKGHTVVFSPASKTYAVVERGTTVFQSESVAACLAISTGIVLDDLARSFIPSWEY